MLIVASLRNFGNLIAEIETERDKMVRQLLGRLPLKGRLLIKWMFYHLQLANAHDRIVVPLETFRKEHIGGVKENKKLFYKKTAKYCQAQERCLAMSSKRPDNAVREVSWREEF